MIKANICPLRCPGLWLYLVIGLGLWSVSPGLFAADTPVCTGAIDQAVVLGLDEVRWPSAAIRIEVLANDYDVQGKPLEVVSVSPGSLGTATVDEDTVVFTPTAPAPAGSASITYTVRTIEPSPRTATGTITFINPAAPAPQGKTITWEARCEARRCFFTAKPSVYENVRHYGWTFWSGLPNQSTPTTCSKTGWRGTTTYCEFATTGTKHVDVSATYYGGETVFYTATLNVTDLAPEVEWSLHGDVDPAQATVFTSLKAGAQLVRSNSKASSTKHYVDFGDGTKQELAFDGLTGWHGYVDHQYETPGRKEVKIVLEENGAVIAAFPKSVEVRNKPPVVEFDATEMNAAKFHFAPSLTDEHLVYELRSSVPGPLAPKQYEWDFGDGTTAQKAVTFVDYDGITHEYASRGTYPVTLRVVDNNGAASTATHEIVVTNALPVPRFTFECTGARGTTCTFDASASTDDVGINRYLWRFGDGTTAETANPTKSFSTGCSAPGSNPCAFIVELQVSDDDGGSRSTLQTVTVLAAAAPAAAAYYGLTIPCRVFDSRNGSVLTPASPRRVQVRGNCAVPSDATSVAVNITVVAPATAGQLFVEGADAQRHSTLEWFEVAGTPLAAFAVLRLDGTGGLTSRVLGTDTHVLIDVVGVFRASTSALADAKGPLWYAPVFPCRVIDSRLSPPSLAAGVPRAYNARTCGVAADAVATASNLTLIAPTADSHAIVFPGTTPPAISTMNLKPGRIRSNGAFVLIGANSQQSVVLSHGAGDFATDATGYFSANASLAFVPVPVCRANLAGPFDVRRENNYRIRGNCGIPATAAAALIRVHTRYYSEGGDTDGEGHVRVWAAGSAPPGTSLVNFKFARAGTAPEENSVENTAVVALGPAGSADLATMLTFIGNHRIREEVTVYGYFVPKAAASAAAPEATEDGGVQ